MLLQLILVIDTYIKKNLSLKYLIVNVAILAREAGLLARLRHPNIVSLYKVIDTGATVVLLLELISGGELFHWIPSNEAEVAHVVSKKKLFYLVYLLCYNIIIKQVLQYLKASLDETKYICNKIYLSILIN